MNIEQKIARVEEIIAKLDRGVDVYEIDIPDAFVIREVLGSQLRTWKRQVEFRKYTHRAIERAKQSVREITVERILEEDR